MKKILKPVYLTALFPLASTALYLALMGLSTTEDFGFGVLAIIGFLAVTVAWGFIGLLFAKSKVLLFPATLIANIIPIITTIVYAVLFCISQVTESDAMLETAEIIGGLGTGFFGILGTLLYALIPLALFEVFINFGFSILVFIIGYSIGASGASRGKKK